MSISVVKKIAEFVMFGGILLSVLKIILFGW